MSDVRAARALYAQGLALQNTQQHQDAAACLRKALAEYEGTGSLREQASVANSLGWSYQQQEQVAEAEESYRRASELAEAAGNDEERVQAEENLARLRGHPPLEPRFESEVEAWERDAAIRPMGGILFYGSSSIRLWPLAESFPRYPIVNRGFGGSRIGDCIRYLPRLVIPFQPRMIILYVGDNDLADRVSPADILARLGELVDSLRRALPESRILFISIKPSPLHIWITREIEETNARIRARSKEAGFDFLDIYAEMLGPDGSPDTSYFSEDGLHLAPAGYAVWTKAVNRYLKDVWQPSPERGEHSPPVRREHHQMSSRSLDRQMDLLVFGHAGTRVLVFPTLHGSYRQAEELGLVDALSHRLAGGELQLFCVDAFDSDSFYNQQISPRERILRHLQFERHILDDVLPLSQELNPGSPLVAQGCSIGAFHAMNIAFRHPDRFERVVALSGRYELNGDFGGGFRDLFDGYYDSEIYFNSPSHFLPNLTDADILQSLRRLDVLMAVGEWDSFIENNRRLSAVLTDKAIPHRLLVWTGVAHGYRHWTEALRLYL